MSITAPVAPSFLTAQETVIIEASELDAASERVYAMVDLFNVLTESGEQIYAELTESIEDGADRYLLEVRVKDNPEHAIELLAELLRKAKLTVAPQPAAVAAIEPWPGVSL